MFPAVPPPPVQSPPSPMPSVAFYRNHKGWPSPVVCICVYFMFAPPNGVPWEGVALWNVGMGSTPSSAAADEGNLALGGWNQGPSRWARLAQTQGHVALSGLPPNAPRSAQGGGAARPPSALFLPQEGRPQVRGAGGGDPRKQMGQ